MGIKNQHPPRDANPTEASDQVNGKRAATHSNTSNWKLLVKKIRDAWQFWKKVKRIIIGLVVLLLMPFILKEKWEARSQRDADTYNVIDPYIYNYVSTERSIMGASITGASLYPAERESVVNWFSNRLAILNRSRSNKISVHSSLREKAQAAEEIIDRNLKLMDRIDWDNGANFRFSWSYEVIERGGGDETDLALMKAAFLRIMGVSDDSAYVVLYTNSAEEDIRGVAVVKMPDGKEFYLDKTKSSRDSKRKTYREYVEFGVGHSKKERPS